MHEARSYLTSLEQIGIKLGLDQIRALVRALDFPDRAFPSIVVAGTNGKGSVTAMTERGLRAAGLRTGWYTSPHLVDLEERFAIDGKAVSATTLDDAAARVQDVAAQLPAPPSFFEATTAVALEIFRRARVEVAVLEVGLGGRLDATNVVSSVVEAITLIDLDHQQYLGTTVEAIAREKAGIIKPGTTVVLGANLPSVRDVIAEVASTVGARLVATDLDTQVTAELRGGHADVRITTPDETYEATLSLAGRHQVQNAVTAVRLLEEYRRSTGCGIPREAILTALEDTTWPARLEARRHGSTEVLIDGAHNPSGARALAAHVRETYGRRLPFVIGMMRDKDVDGIVAAFATVASVFCCTAPTSARALDATTLAEFVGHVAPAVPCEAIADPIDAVNRAAARGGPVVVAGSLYLAGQIRAQLS